MDIEMIEGLLPFALFILIAVLSGSRKRKGNAKKPIGKTAAGSPAQPLRQGKKSGVTPQNSSAFAAHEMAEEHVNLSGKVHSREHTHDRLDFDCYVPESQEEHFRRQLDGFLKTGLIEREEYLAIVKKYTEQGILQ